MASALVAIVDYEDEGHAVEMSWVLRTSLSKAIYPT